MLPDCVGVWYASCSSWVKSESLNRRYLSFCFLTILALIRRNKKQTAEKGNINAFLELRNDFTLTFLISGCNIHLQK